MTDPIRLQLSRAKGFDLQAASLALNGRPAINIARPGPLGNPFIVGRDGDRARCVELFEILLSGFIAVTTKARPESQEAVRNYLADNLAALRDQNVACWCPLDARCHGDSLLRVFKCREVR